MVFVQTSELLYFKHSVTHDVLLAKLAAIIRATNSNTCVYIVAPFSVLLIPS